MASSPPLGNHNHNPNAVELPASTNKPSPKYRPYRPPKREEKYIAIGIDFGTTYSGVSWAYSAAPEDIHHVAHWPFDGPRGKDEVQIPTLVDLANKNPAKNWGYLVSKNADPIRWFKLLLLETRDLKKDMKDKSVPLEVSREKLRKHAGYESDAAINLIAAFLQRLWEHTLEEINHEIDIDLLPIKVAITVPAIWPLYAREKMEKAAKKAGILDARRIGETKLFLVEEPEAAAVSTLYDRKAFPEIEIGESFIVCDCGGGTIDITSYTVTSMDPFIVKEAVKGDGKLCGAFLIDDAFENWMTIKSGLKFDKCEQADVRDFVNEEWEHGIKRGFTGKENSFSIRPPARAFGVVKRAKGATDSYQISSDVVKQFYARTYNGIRELISEQTAQIERYLGKQPKKILLVGGLGSSRYLYTQLHAQYKNVLQPSQAWSAVSRGAVIAVMKNAYNPAGASLGADMDAANPLRSMPHVASRIARASYGAIFGVPVRYAIPPMDSSKESSYVDEEGIERIRRVKWYLKRGESVQDKDPVIHYFHQAFYGADDKTLKLTIQVSEADAPTVWPDKSVQKLCDIECEIDIPWDDMKEMRDPKGKLLQCKKADNLTLSMSFGGAPKWTLKAGGQTTEQKADVKYA